MINKEVKPEFSFLLPWEADPSLLPRLEELAKKKLCECRSQWNPPIPKLKTEWLPTQTVPDDTMSLRNIISKYAQGIPISSTKVPIYDEDNESLGINPKTLDLVDIQELKAQNQKKLRELQAELQASTDFKEKSKLKAERDALEKQIREEIKKDAEKDGNALI